MFCKRFEASMHKFGFRYKCVVKPKHTLCRRETRFLRQKERLVKPRHIHSDLIVAQFGNLNFKTELASDQPSCKVRSCGNCQWRAPSDTCIDFRKVEYIIFL